MYAELERKQLNYINKQTNKQQQPQPISSNINPELISDMKIHLR